MYTTFIGEHSLEHFHKSDKGVRQSSAGRPSSWGRAVRFVRKLCPLFLCKALFCYKEKLSISIKSIYFIYRRLAK